MPPRYYFYLHFSSRTCFVLISQFSVLSKLLFITKKCRIQRDLNSDHRSRRWARWPLEPNLILTKAAVNGPTFVPLGWKWGFIGNRKSGLQAVWPEKNRQMPIKVAQELFHLKNDGFWQLHKNCLIGQINCCQRL